MHKALVTICITGVLGLTACGPATDPTPTATPKPVPTSVTALPSPTESRPPGVPTEAQEVTVVKITDGDTVALRASKPGQALASVTAITSRLLEVDTPETKHPTKPVQCYGPEATKYTQQLLPIGSRAWIMADRETRDRYGRYLFYVWNHQGLFVNQEIIRTGHGRALLVAPNDLHIATMRQAEKQAKANRWGLWGACSTPTATTTPSIAPSTAS